MSPDGDPRRLGIWSLGLLRRRELKDALRAAGWAARPGFLPVDAVGVWGRSAAAKRGMAAARRAGAPLLTLEDGFLRSVSPGPGAPVLSLILDDLGVYYDCARPSRLEISIEEGAYDEARARAALALLRRLKLSKYNDAPELAAPPRDHVLVIDQTRGDRSIAGAGADARSFAGMLNAARSENPGAEIVIRPHPETVLGRKPGHFGPEDETGGARIWGDPANIWDLTSGARAVYTVSSQSGFEALLAGAPVRCFGTPFYAGWGATEDETPAPRRAARRDTLAIFAAAYLDYPLYFDPWAGGLSDFERTAFALASLRAHWLAVRGGAVVSGARLWKRGQIARFFAPAPVSFVDDPVKAARAGRRRVVWGGRPGATGLEDGFLRSAGLGAELTPPLSLALDDEGIYFDPQRPSRLERLIAEAPADEASLARAERLAARIVALGLSKYNLRGAPAPERPEGRRAILVPGQVEDDASIRLGAGEIRTNLALLKAVRKAAPEAWVLYKPHPDVEAGLRPGRVDPAALRGLADAVAENVPAAAALATVDEVWTITSLIGFEALLRGRRVVTFGAPFYAGWGLTEDRGEIPARRVARPALAQLVHAALIDYPLYLDPVTKRPCPPEAVVERLAAGAGPKPPGLKLLAKAQGLLASYAQLWR